jgi:hypothetical protein
MKNLILTVFFLLTYSPILFSQENIEDNDHLLEIINEFNSILETVTIRLIEDENKANLHINKTFEPYRFANYGSFKKTINSRNKKAFSN